MLLPENDPIKHKGIKICVLSTYEFFCKAFPEITKNKGLVFTEEQLIAMYTLAGSDEEYTQMMAKQWGIDIDAEAVDLPALLAGEINNG